MSPCLGIPELHGAVVRRRREPPAVIRGGDGINWVCMASERRLISARLNFPEPHGAVASGLPRNCSEPRIADPEIATELLCQAGTSVEGKSQESWINCFPCSAGVLLKFIT
jgi:hypothetical protein